MDGIDAIDRRLLDLLRVDGRASWADLGGRVGLSASAVRRRVDRLTARGVVQGFTVQVDPDAERTPGVAAYVELFCRGTVAPAELQRMLSAVPEVVTAGTVTGRPTRWSCCARATCSPWRTPWNDCDWRRTSTTPARPSSSRGWSPVELAGARAYGMS